MHEASSYPPAWWCSSLLSFQPAFLPKPTLIRNFSLELSLMVIGSAFAQVLETGIEAGGETEPCSIHHLTFVFTSLLSLICNIPNNSSTTWSNRKCSYHNSRVGSLPYTAGWFFWSFSFHAFIYLKTNLQDVFDRPCYTYFPRGNSCLSFSIFHLSLTL